MCMYCDFWWNFVKFCEIVLYWNFHNNNSDLLLGSYHSNSDKLSKLPQKKEKTLLEMEKDDFRKLSMYQVFDKMENFQQSNSVPKISFILYNVRIRIYPILTQKMEQNYVYCTYTKALWNKLKYSWHSSQFLTACIRFCAFIVCTLYIIVYCYNGPYPAMKLSCSPNQSYVG